MIGLIQRVSWAKVEVDDRVIGQINQGILALIGMEKNDQPEQADKLLHLSVMDIQGGVLLVPQFTLAADTKKGLRPSFSSAKPPSEAQVLFTYLLKQTRHQYTAHYQQAKVESGLFGADMKVSLLNDGPVTFSLTV